MNQVAENEKSLAVAAGDVDVHGNGLITVVADGSWAKRSYKNKYNSLSAVAAIIGWRTKKILFIGVRNKYCTICRFIERNNKSWQDHKCFKNWTDSSTSMEGDILAEASKCMD